jgi:hypothetical protein
VGPSTFILSFPPYASFSLLTFLLLSHTYLFKASFSFLSSLSAPFLSWLLQGKDTTGEFERDHGVAMLQKYVTHGRKHGYG